MFPLHFDTLDVLKYIEDTPLLIDQLIIVEIGAGLYNRGEGGGGENAMVKVVNSQAGRFRGRSPGLCNLSEGIHEPDDLPLPVHYVLIC